MSEIKMRFVDPEGVRHDLIGPAGQSLMEAAVAHRLDGIEAECGGACSCATCHVYIDEDWMAAAGQPSSLEAEMLDFARSERRPNSRLSCQIRLRPELDGIRLTIAGD